EAELPALVPRDVDLALPLHVERLVVARDVARDQRLEVALQMLVATDSDLGLPDERSQSSVDEGIREEHLASLPRSRAQHQLLQQRALPDLTSADQRVE